MGDSHSCVAFLLRVLFPSRPKVDGWNSERIPNLKSLELTKQLEVERENPGRGEQQSLCINTPQILG